MLRGQVIMVVSGARLRGRRRWLGGVAFTLLVLVYSPGGVSDASRSPTVVGTPTHPQTLTCNEEATQFTGGTPPPVGPHDIGFGAGYFPQATPPGVHESTAQLWPRGSTHRVQAPSGCLSGSNGDHDGRPWQRGPTWCNKTLGRHAKGACRSRTGPVCTNPVSFPRASGSPMVEYEAAFRSTCGSAGSERRATSCCRSSLDGAEPRPDPLGVRGAGHRAEGVKSIPERRLGDPFRARQVLIAQN